MSDRRGFSRAGGGRRGRNPPAAERGRRLLRQHNLRPHQRHPRRTGCRRCSSGSQEIAQFTLSTCETMVPCGRSILEVSPPSCTP